MIDLENITEKQLMPLEISKITDKMKFSVVSDLQNLNNNLSKWGEMQ